MITIQWSDVFFCDKYKKARAIEEHTIDLQSMFFPNSEVAKSSMSRESVISLSTQINLMRRVVQCDHRNNKIHFVQKSSRFSRNSSVANIEQENVRNSLIENV